jgi:hypothetical protein
MKKGTTEKMKVIVEKGHQFEERKKKVVRMIIDRAIKMAKEEGEL